MSTRRAGSLLWRLVAVQVGVLAVVWAFLVAESLIQGTKSGGALIDSDLSLIGAALSRMTSPSDDRTELERAAGEVRDMTVENSDGLITAADFAYQIWSADGRLLARSQELPPLPDLPPGTLPEARSEDLDGWIARGVWNPARTRYAVAAQSERSYGQLLRSATLGVIPMFLMLAAALSAMLALSVRFVLKPLRGMAAAIDARQPEDLSPIDPAATFGELRPFVVALNSQFERVAGLLAEERRFFADAAHELRTPLAAIGAQAHVLANEPAGPTRDAASAAMDRGIDRAARVVSRLLMMGRLQSTQRLRDLGTHDLALVAANCVDGNRHRARQAGQTLLLAGATQLDCRFDPEALAAALDNLLDNALLYTPTGSTIVVSIRREDADVVIEVADDGPGIAPEDRKRIFERFERLNRSDSRGSGLGLAIVRRIAELHGGTADCSAPSSGQGAVFTLRIPA